jgi:hypothetical protein
MFRKLSFEFYSAYVGRAVRALAPKARTARPTANVLNSVKIRTAYPMRRVPKLQLGNPVNETLGNCSLRFSTSCIRAIVLHPCSRPASVQSSCIHAVAASRDGKLELPALGAWELALLAFTTRYVGTRSKFCSARPTADKAES